MKQIVTRTVRTFIAAGAALTLASMPASADWFDGFGGANGVDGTVTSMTAWNGGVVVGGRFTMAGGMPANSIAFWDGAGWSTLGSGLEQGPFGVEVWDLTVHQGNVIAAGNFRSAGGTAIRGIASWNGTTWDSLGTGMRNEMSSLDAVFSLYSDGDILYAGGEFETMGGVTVGNIAKWDGFEWSPVEGTGVAAATPGVDGRVNSIFGFQDDLYVGGAFFTSGTIPVSNLARWTGATWEDLDSGTNGEVRAILNWNLSGRDLLVVAGNFITVDDPFEAAAHVATLDPATGLWETPGTEYWLTGVNGEVRELGAYDGRLAIVGNFDEDEFGAALRYAATFGSLENRWEPFGGGLDNQAITMAEGEDELWMGGTFLGVTFRGSGASGGTISSNHIARWDGGVVPVSLSSFTADRLGRDVVVRWVIDTASDHAGFHVHRDFGSGAKIRLTDALLSGRGAYTFTDTNPPLGGLRYWLEEIDGGGRSTWHGPVSPAASPGSAFAHLAPVHPNPVRRSAAISFAFDEPTNARVTVHDASGRAVITLHEGVVSGAREITWDGRSRDGREVPAGVYFVTLSANGVDATEKFVWAR